MPKKILPLTLVAILGISFITIPVFADDPNPNCVKTSIIGGGEVCDSGDGDSVIQILNLIVDIMTVGIGILGVIGITIVGIQYLTAGGSEEKTRKAKRRMFEIVIGLVAYVLIYAALKWLLPSFGS